MHTRPTESSRHPGEQRPGLLGEPWAAVVAWVDRLPLARRWGRRHANVALGLLTAATFMALAGPQARSFPFLVAATLLFVVLIVMEAHRPCLDRRLVKWISLGLLLAAVAAPPRDSADVWSYAMYGRMVSHYHADPYRISPQVFSGDVWFWRVSVWWRDTRTVYGPVFTEVSALGMRLVGDSALRARLFFQALAAGSVAGSLLLLDRRRVPAGALAFLGLSPMVIVNIVNGAHNDTLVGFFALVGVLAVAGGQSGAGPSERRAGAWVWVAGLALGVAALVKLIALLPAGAVVVWVWRREGHRPALKLAAACGGAVGLGYLLMGGTAALAPLQEASRMVDHFSLYGWFGHMAPAAKTGQGPLGGLLISPVPKAWLTGWVRLVPTIMVVLLAGLMMVAGSSDSRPSAGAAAAVLAFVLATSYIQPWYLTAMLPLLALQWRSRLAFLGAGYALVLMLAVTWQSSTGLVRTILKVPLTWIFPVYQLLTLAALGWLALRQLRGKPVSLRSLLAGDLLRDEIPVNTPG